MVSLQSSLRVTITLALVMVCLFTSAQKAVGTDETIEPTHQFTEGLEKELAVGHAFGFAVALSGDGTTAAISTVPTNLVYIYQLIEGDWQLTTTLTVSRVGGGFGYSLAFDATGTTLMVGDPFATTDKGPRGLVHVYMRTEDKWQKKQELEAMSTTEILHFGSPLVLSGDGSILLVGAPNTNKETGAVFAFELDGEMFNQVAELTRTDMDLFGLTLVLSGSGDKALIGGDPLIVDQPVATIVYARDTNGMWKAEAELISSDFGKHSSRRNALALNYDGTLAAIGTPERSVNDEMRGAVHLFEKSIGGWRESITLAAPEGARGFGAALAFTQADELLLVSEDGPANVRVYRAAPQGFINAYDLETSKGEAFIGYSDPLAIASDGNLVLVGLPGFYGSHNLPPLLFELPEIHP